MIYVSTVHIYICQFNLVLAPILSRVCSPACTLSRNAFGRMAFACMTLMCEHKRITMINLILEPDLEPLPL